MSLVSAFETRVNVNIVGGLVKLGCFEKEGLSLALGTTSWNVVILSPHSAAQESSSGSTALKKRLAINRDITAIESAHFDGSGYGGDSDGDGVDLVLIGTTTNLLCYNVETNADVFYVDVPDGVNAILFVDGHELAAFSNGKAQPMVLVGGNCSIQCFDRFGEEVFWTVTSDNVRCLVLVDIDGDGHRELLVGSEDCSIKGFRGEEVIYSVSESDTVAHLQALGDGDRFGYGLENGTIGVYAGNSRLWRARNKERVTAMTAYDVSDDRTQPLLALIVGYSSGLVEARKIETGKVLWSSFVMDTASGSTGTSAVDGDAVAGIVCGDLRGRGGGGSGGGQMITVSAKGVIAAWIPKAKTPRNPQRDKTRESEHPHPHPQHLLSVDNVMASFRKSMSALTVNGDEDGDGGLGLGLGAMASAEEMDEFETAMRRRDELKEEADYLSANWKTLRSGDLDDPSLIPPETEIACTLTPSIEQKRLLLIMNTNNSTVIKAAVIYGDRVFESGCFMLVPSAQSSSITLPLRFEKDLQCTLSIKAMVGHLSSSQNHVFELSHRIPQFASYLYVPTASIPTDNRPRSHCLFVLKERVNRLILWLNQAFLLEYEPNTKRTVDISFVSLRNGQYVTLQCGASNHIKVCTDDLTLCGDVVQDIARYLSITELHSHCHFESHFETLRENMQRVEQFNEIRNRLSSDMAANTDTIKNLLVKAHDARVQRSYHQFKRQFSELHDVNQEMLGEFQKRRNNHRHLVAALKATNQTIERVSRLRVGKYQKMTVTLSRNAIKKNNVDALINALRDCAAGK